MEWADDVANRPRRANAGNRLQELLQSGLNDDDEKDLLQLDNSSSDSSFTLGSDEEAIDEVESDFDAEEVAGVLEGEAVETEATVRREERQARMRERQKKLQRTQKFSKAAAAHDRAVRRRARERQRKHGGGGGVSEQRRRKRERRSTGESPSASDSNASDDDGSADDDESVDLRQRVRHRPAPTIPCARRLEEAHQRAATRRAAQAALAEGEEDGAGEGQLAGASMLNSHRGLNMGKSRQRPRRGAGQRRVGARLGVAGDEATGAGGGAAAQMTQIVSPRIALYNAVPQRIGYSSGVSIRERFHAPTVLSFSEALPPVFQNS